MSDLESTPQDTVSKLLDKFLESLDRATGEPPAPERANAREFYVKNSREYLVVYHGGEVVAKVKPEHGDQLIGELTMALKKRRGEYDGEF